MPYRLEKKDPLDLSKRKAIGVQFPFRGDSAFTSTYQTIKAYKANLLVYFLTNKGDRYLNPDFGSNLRKYMFEQMPTDSQQNGIKSIIKQDLSTFFPRLVLDVLDINTFEDYNILQLYIKFHIKDTYLEDELTINYE